MKRGAPSSERGAGVAAVALAATLALVGCAGGSHDVRAGASGGEMAAVDVESALETRWLVAPDPSLDPPLAAPVALGVDPDRGRLLVLELRPPELRVYGLAAGEFRGTLGREGDGPGEYRHPTAVAVAESGLIAVLSMSGRVAFWAPDGTLAGIVQAGAGISTDIFPARGDSFYVKTDIFPPEDVSVFRVVTRDTVLGRPRFRDAGVPGTDEPGRRFRNHAYAVAGTGDGGLLISPPGPEYLILRLAPVGRLQRTIRRSEVAPLVRSEAEVEAIREHVRKGFAATGRSAPAKLPVSRRRSHVSRLAVAPDGSIWALTGRRGPSNGMLIDRFAPGGSFVASYEVPLRVSDLVVTAESIYFLARADLDVPGIAVAARPGGTVTGAAGGE